MITTVVSNKRVNTGLVNGAMGFGVLRGITVNGAVRFAHRHPAEHWRPLQKTAEPAGWNEFYEFRRPGVFLRGDGKAIPVMLREYSLNMQMAVQENRGWQARLELGYEMRGGKTRLVHRSQRGPLAVQRPFYPQAGVCHTYLLHPPGGVVGGDELEIDVRVATGAHALVTTPGATKFYRCAGLTAHQTQHLRVEAGGTLEWLPQENIFFPGASSRLRSRIEVATGGRFVGWELNCLGRPANQESFGFGRIDSRCELLLDGRPVLIDQLQVRGPDQFAAAAGMRGHAMVASLYALPADDAMLERVQSLIDERFAALPIGATLVDSVLAVRMLGQNSEDIQAALIPIWEQLRLYGLGLEPCPPRIWST